MAVEIKSITVDDKAGTVHVELTNGQGQEFFGTLAEYAEHVKATRVARDDWSQVIAVLDAKLAVDPTLKDTTDIIAKPIEYKPPVVVKPAKVVVEGVK